MAILSAQCVVWLIAMPAFAAEYFVDASAAAGGTGSSVLPFQTIQAGADAAQPGDTVTVRSGKYRERVKPPRGGTSGNLITYRAAAGASVTITGLDPWSPTWTDESGNVFSAIPAAGMFQDTAYVDGGNPYTIPTVRVDNMVNRDVSHTLSLGHVVVDGIMWEEKGRKVDMESTSRSWWCDLTTGRIHIHFPTSNPSSYQVEITTRRGVFRPYLRGLGYIVADGFTMEYCANQFPDQFWVTATNHQSGLIGTRAGHHWQIRNCTFRRAKSIAMSVGCGGYSSSDDNENPQQNTPAKASVGFNVIENNVIEFNGSGGIQGLGHNGSVISNNYFRRNNYLEHKSYEMGCIKFHDCYDTTITSNKFENNDCMGIWVDNTVKRTKITRNLIRGSSGPGIAGDGIFIELVEEGAGNEVTVDNNIIVGVERYGIYAHDASYAIIANNLISGSGKAGMHLRDLSTAAVRKGNCHDHQIFNNLLFNNQSPIQLPFDWSTTTLNNRCDRNVFYPSSERFAITSYSKAEDSKATIQAGIYSAWQAAGSVAPNLTGNEWETAGAANGYWSSLAQWRVIRANDINSVYAAVNQYSFDSSTYTLTMNLDGTPATVGAIPVSGVTTDYLGNAIGGSPLAGPFQNLVTGANTIALWPGYQTVISNLVNTPPIGNRQSATTAEDTAKVIALTGSDVDRDALTYAIVTVPAHGTLSGTAPALTYTPTTNYNGSDSFTFKVNDGKVDSAVATVSITVTAVVDPPVNVYFAGGESNATSNWATAAQAAIISRDPNAIVVHATHPGQALRNWHTSYAYNSVTGRQGNYLADLYDPGAGLGALETAFNNAVLSGKTPRLAGLLWFQGETDSAVAESYTGTGYYQEFLSFIGRIEDDFNLDEPLRVCLAVIDITNAPTEQTRIDAIRTQQTALGNLSTIWAYDTRGLARTDGVNLSTTAGQTAGTAMAACLFPGIFVEDFESGLGNWTVTNTVTANASAQSPFDDEATDLQGALFQDDTLTASKIERTFTVGTDKVLYIQFDYFYTGTVTNTGFQLLNGTTVGLNMHLTAANGNSQNRSPSAFTNLVVMQSEAWYRFTLTVQPSSSASYTYDLRIQSLDTGPSTDTNFTGLPFQTNLTAFNKLRFHYNIPTATAGGQYRIDNVVVTTSTKDLNFLADTDADGIDDSWERLHFGNLTTSTATSNSDSDSQTDLQEYLSGTNPTSGQSSIVISGITHQSSGPVINWQAAEGFQYDVLWSTNLSNWSLYSIHYGRGVNMRATVEDSEIDVLDGIPGNLNKLFLKLDVRPLHRLPQ